MQHLRRIWKNASRVKPIYRWDQIGLSHRSPRLRDGPAEGRRGRLRKDRLRNRLRHAENYADAVIPDNSAAVSRANYRESRLWDARCAIYGKAKHRFRTRPSHLGDPFFYWAFVLERNRNLF